MNTTPTQFQAVDGGGSFFGGLLVLYGTLALLMHYGLVPSIAYWKLWPLIPIWLGLLRTTEPGRRVSGLFWTAAGGLVLAYYFGVLQAPLEWALLWPLGLIALGLRIWGGHRNTHHHSHRRLRYREPEENPTMNQDQKPLDIVLMMAGRQDKLDNRGFSGGRIRCTASGYELDLRGATMIGPEAILDLEVTMGGVDIQVPRSWRVEMDVAPMLGGADDESHCANPEGAPLLTLRGRVLMGGVSVRN